MPNITHSEKELLKLKEDMYDMMLLVKSQSEKSREVVKNFDKELAREVRYYEKRVNAFELKLDRDCENILALYSPVAIDLRLVLATFKINTHLERIADNAEGISSYIIYLEKAFDEKLLAESRFFEMFDTMLDMLQLVIQSFQNEDSKNARKVFKLDDTLDEINGQAPAVLTEYCKKNTEKIFESYLLLSSMRKIERSGDLIENVAEEIIFYKEAQIYKHNKKLMEKQEDANL
jgi:phosphate transport system protein